MSTNLRALMKACLVGVVYNWMRSFQGKVCSWGGIQTKLSHFGAVIFRENYYKSRIHSAAARIHRIFFVPGIWKAWSFVWLSVGEIILGVY
jgi:hypothetical protein